jgi:hypothetical protein
MRMNRFIGSKLPVCQRSRMGISSSFDANNLSQRYGR